MKKGTRTAIAFLHCVVYSLLSLASRFEGRCPMPKGTIRRLMDRGFGFIKGEEEGDLFFHRNDIEGVEFGSLREGQEVEFEKGQGRDGRPQAVKVRLAQPK
jgi:CspA family cold shock protein